MNLKQALQAALTQTGIEVTQRPVSGGGEIYLTWNIVMGQFDEYASNQATRIRHMATVDIFARQPVPGARLTEILDILRQNRFKVRSWGPEDYESDTEWHHLPITVEYNELLEG